MRPGRKRQRQRGYALLGALLLCLLVACAPGNEQVRKDQDRRTDSPACAAAEETKKTPATPAGAGKNEYPDSAGRKKLPELRQALLQNGVPGEWFDSQVRHATYRLHADIDRCFQNSAEKQVDRQKKRPASWYFARLGVAAKIKKGKKFLQANSSVFARAEARHGIHRELIAAIMGIETNFAAGQQRGKYYAFNALVSQYLFTKRQDFAVREITALYKFSQKSGRPPQYFTSSYAGAIGWGQFIPSSLLAFFVDTQGVDLDMDPFSLEDTIFSVENYLAGHDLSARNIDDYDARYKAVFSYNNSDVYVQAVLGIYDGLRRPGGE